MVMKHRIEILILIFFSEEIFADKVKLLFQGLFKVNSLSSERSKRGLCVEMTSKTRFILSFLSLIDISLYFAHMLNVKWCHFE